MSKSDPGKPKRLAMIASKGTLDWAYPPFILGSTAAAMGWECGIFFTFYGLTLLRKEIAPQVTPLGNPAMPMKMPFGPQGFQAINWPIPTLVEGLPGFGALATTLMKKTFKNNHVASIDEMRDMCIQLGVRMIACEMTIEVFGFDRAEFIPSAEFMGAAAYLEYAADAEVSLFI